MKCLQNVMTEEIKEDNDYKFQFVEGICKNCEDLSMVTSCYYYGVFDKDKVSKKLKIEPNYMTMRKAYQ